MNIETKLSIRELKKAREAMLNAKIFISNQRNSLPSDEVNFNINQLEKRLKDIFDLIQLIEE